MNSPNILKEYSKYFLHFSIDSSEWFHVTWETDKVLTAVNGWR